MSELLRTPTVPSAILNFFASQPDFPAVVGDITEEFHQRAQSAGARAAKRWYWREAFRNALALSWRELMRTPVRTTLLALACVVLVHLIESSLIIAQVTLLRWSGQLKVAIVILLYFMPVLPMGWISGKLLPGREWALSLTFTFIPQCFVLLIWASLHPTPIVAWHSWLYWMNPLHQGLFWLGCLMSRQARLPEKGVSQHV